MSVSPAGSYPDAYAKVFAKDSNRPVSRGSYAEAHARKQSPSPAKRQEYYSPTVGAWAFECMHAKPAWVAWCRRPQQGSQTHRACLLPCIRL